MGSAIYRTDDQRIDDALLLDRSDQAIEILVLRADEPVFLPRNQLFDINQCSTFRHFLSPYAADAVTAGVTTRSSMAIFWAIVSCASGLWVTTTVW